MAQLAESLNVKGRSHGGFAALLLASSCLLDKQHPLPCLHLPPRFHPAPLYILDEVDSALDINNSQNIGHMIKQHFPTSQVRGRGAWGGAQARTPSPL